MKGKRTIRSAVWKAVIASLAFGAAMLAVPPRDLQAIKESLPQKTRVPVMVELFTPEGCADCPAADERLKRLESQPVPGAEIIVLDEHLDYASGWREPQSARAMTNRQVDYGRLFHNDNIFGPQMIVGGSVQLLGPETQHVTEEIARAAKGPRANVEVEFQSASVASIKIDHVPEDAPACDLWMAITESNLQAAAPEGSGATPAVHNGVVRSMVILGRVDSSGPVTYNMHLRFNPRWKRDDLKYVVFLQDRVSRRIWGATAVAP